MKWIFQNLFAIVPHFDLKMIHNSFLAKIPRNSAMHSELSSVILPYWSRIIFFPISVSGWILGEVVIDFFGYHPSGWTNFTNLFRWHTSI